MMIKVDAGYIPFIEPFFSNMRTYFFLDVIRILKVKLVTLEGKIFELLGRQ